MIEFIDTALQLQPIRTAHTFELFLNVCLTNLSKESLTNLNLGGISTALEFTNERLPITATQPEYKSPCRTVICPLLLYICQPLTEMSTRNLLGG
jgi:hypothetical protein